jgi:hypothetical protein
MGSSTQVQAEHKGPLWRRRDGKVVVTTEVAKDRKRDAVRGLQISFASGNIIGVPLSSRLMHDVVQLVLVAIGRRLYIEGKTPVSGSIRAGAS